jgi:hypothetical protein
LAQSPAQLLAYESAQKVHTHHDDRWVLLPWTPFDEYVRSLKGTVCLYCASGLETTIILKEIRQQLEVRSCYDCGWWSIFREAVGGQDNVGLTFSVADAKVFDVGDIEAPLESLRRYLGRNPRDLAEINPTSFERLVQDCLEDEFAPCEVAHLGGTGDGGIDLKLIQSDQEPILIQVKRHADLSSVEGLNVIRELNGVLLREGQARGMVVTTAARFARGAPRETTIKTADLAGRYEMQLRAFDDVVSMLQVPMRKTPRPWLEYLPSYCGLGGGIDDAIEGHLEEMDTSPTRADS